MKTILSILIMLLCHLLHAQQVSRQLVPEWSQTYTWEDHALYSERCANGDMVLFSQPADRSLHLLRYGPDGSLLWDSSWSAFRAFGRLYISAVREGQEGTLYVLLNAPERETMVLKFSREGKLLFVQSLLSEMKKNSLSYGITLFVRDSSLACYGIKGGDLWETVLDKKGKIIVESLFEWEEDHFVMDIITRSDGTPLILAKSEITDPSGSNNATTYLLAINYQHHRLEKWNSFPGRNASICRFGNSSYALTVDTCTVSLKQSFLLHILDQQLVLRNTVKLFDNDMGVSPAKLLPWSYGLIGIAGIRNGNLHVMAMDADGMLQAEYQQQNSEKLMLLKRISLDEKQLACFYVFDTGNSPEPKTMNWFRTKQAFFRMDNLIGKE
jgi:hypothetical protein